MDCYVSIPTQEIEMLLQSSQRDWSSPSQSEEPTKTNQDKDVPGSLPNPESTPEPTT
jgi:hypothetical protein